MELAVAEDEAAIVSVAEQSVADNLGRGVDLERFAPATTKISEICGDSVGKEHRVAVEIAGQAGTASYLSAGVESDRDAEGTAGKRTEIRDGIGLRGADRDRDAQHGGQKSRVVGFHSKS